MLTRMIVKRQVGSAWYSSVNGELTEKEVGKLITRLVTVTSGVITKLKGTFSSVACLKERL